MRRGTRRGERRKARQRAPEGREDFVGLTAEGAQGGWLDEERAVETSRVEAFGGECGFEHRVARNDFRLVATVPDNGGRAGLACKGEEEIDRRTGAQDERRTKRSASL